MMWWFGGFDLEGQCFDEGPRQRQIILTLLRQSSLQKYLKTEMDCSQELSSRGWGAERPRAAGARVFKKPNPAETAVVTRHA